MTEQTHTPLPQPLSEGSHVHDAKCWDTDPECARFRIESLLTALDEAEAALVNLRKGRGGNCYCGDFGGDFPRPDGVRKCTLCQVRNAIKAARDGS